MAFAFNSFNSFGAYPLGLNGFGAVPDLKLPAEFKPEELKKLDFGGIPWDYGFGLTPAPAPKEEKKPEPAPAPKEEKKPDPAPAPAPCPPPPPPGPSPAFKVLAEVFNASEGFSRPAAGEGLNLGDALEFYEWLREKKRRQNIAKLLL